MSEEASSFFSQHKKKLLLAGGVLVSTGLAALGIIKLKDHLHQKKVKRILIVYRKNIFPTLMAIARTVI